MVTHNLTQMMTLIAVNDSLEEGKRMDENFMLQLQTATHHVCTEILRVSRPPTDPIHLGQTCNPLISILCVNSEFSTRVKCYVIFSLKARFWDMCISDPLLRFQAQQFEPCRTERDVERDTAQPSRRLLQRRCAGHGASSTLINRPVGVVARWLHTI